MAHTDFYWHKRHCYIKYRIWTIKDRCCYFSLHHCWFTESKLETSHLRLVLKNKTLVNVGQTITVPYWVVPVRRRSVCSFYLQIKNKNKTKTQRNYISHPSTDLHSQEHKTSGKQTVEIKKLFYCYNLSFIINIALNCLLQLLVSD